jgi:hypothetical protein
MRLVRISPRVGEGVGPADGLGMFRASQAPGVDLFCARKVSGRRTAQNGDRQSDRAKGSLPHSPSRTMPWRRDRRERIVATSDSLRVVR